MQGVSENTSRISSRFETGFIPERYRDARSEKADAMADRLAETGRGYYIFGPVGCGKTYTAVAMLARFVETEDRLVDFVRATDLASMARDFDKRRIGEVTNSPLLVIDDVDKAIAGSDFIHQHIFDVVDSRCSHGKPTIYTANLGPSELGAKAGDDTFAEAILSRINGTCEIVRMGGPDRRLQ